MTADFLILLVVLLLTVVPIVAIVLVIRYFAKQSRPAAAVARPDLTRLGD